MWTWVIIFEIVIANYDALLFEEYIKYEMQVFHELFTKLGLKRVFLPSL